MKTHALALLVVSWLASSLAAAQTGAGAVEASAFDTPRQAADALVAAAAKNDHAALAAIFGPAGKDLLAEVGGENAGAITTFVEKAREKVALVPEPGNPNAVTMEVGSDGWPVPSPIVKSGDKWSFDATIGETEIAARRIGIDELDAIALMRGYVEAQQDYAAAAHDGSTLLQYAQKGMSTPGKQDGLCWKKADRQAGGIQRLLLPNPHGAGPIGAARWPQLHRRQGSRRRVRPARVAREVRRHGRADLHGQPGRPRLPERPRTADRDGRAGDPVLQPGQDLDRHRRRERLTGRRPTRCAVGRPAQRAFPESPE
jgi:Protein of unknown function (DUF2950)